MNQPLPVKLSLRPASRDDMPRVLANLRDLAVVEQRPDGPHAVRATEDQLWAMLDGPRPTGECLMIELADPASVTNAPALTGPNQPTTTVGHVWFYLAGGTFAGKPRLHVEDLCLAPAHRGAGLGRRVMAALARLAIARGCAGLDWSVVKANTAAVRFYERLGAERLTDSDHYALSGDALDRLAQVP